MLGSCSITSGSALDSELRVEDSTLLWGKFRKNLKPHYPMLPPAQFSFHSAKKKCPKMYATYLIQQLVLKSSHLMSVAGLRSFFLFFYSFPFFDESGRKGWSSGVFCSGCANMRLV